MLYKKKSSIVLFIGSFLTCYSNAKFNMCKCAKAAYAEMSERQKSLTAKYNYDEVSLRRSVLTAKCSQGELSL